MISVRGGHLEVPAAIDVRDDKDHSEAKDGDEGNAHAVLCGKERLKD